MLGSPILDLAIGMAFIYLLLSLIASVVQEILATITQARAANLQRGLHSLFSGDPIQIDPDGTARRMFVDALYAHGLVRGLYQDPDQDTRWVESRHLFLWKRFLNQVRGWVRIILRIAPPIRLRTGNDLLLPAYIPARTFALSLMDLLDDRTHGWDSLASIRAHLEELQRRNKAAVDAAPAAAVAAVARKEAAWIAMRKSADGRAKKKGLKQAWHELEHARHSLRICEKQAPDLVKAARAQWRAAQAAGQPYDPPGSAEIRENKAVQALLTLLSDAGEDADQFRINVENWYNDSMDRVSGWYKRYVQNILLFIGLFIAVFFNVDSVRMARTLWFDHDARQGLANAATDYIQTHPNFPAPLAKDADGKDKIPDKQVMAVPSGSSGVAESVPDAGNTGASGGIGAAGDAGDTGKTAGEPAAESKVDASGGFDVDKFKNGLNQTVATFNQVSQETMLPVGWHHGPGFDLTPNAGRGRRVVAWLLAIIGWFITASALSLGAPFWFDTLNKFMVVRGTVKPSEKSPAEASKS